MATSTCCDITCTASPKLHQRHFPLMMSSRALKLKRRRRGSVFRSHRSRFTFSTECHRSDPRYRETDQRQGRKMAKAKTADLDSRVKSYIKNWEMDVSKELQLTKMNLMCCSPGAKAQLKTKYETLGAVLDLLQGKKVKDTCGKRELREEIASLKLKLKEAKDKEKQALYSLRVQVKISADLKVELKRHYKNAKEADRTKQELRQQMKEAQEDFASRLSLVSAVNVDLRSKLEEAQKQLQHPPSWSTEAPLDLAEVQLQLKNSTKELEKQAAFIQSREQRDEDAEPETDEKLQAPTKCQDLRVKMHGALGFKMPERKSDLRGKDVQPDEEGEETTVCLKIGQVKEIMDEAIAEVWKTHEATLEKQRENIEELQESLEFVEDELDIQTLNSREVLERKEQEWADKYEELETRFKEMSDRVRRPRRRNWFVRMFTGCCSRVEDTDPDFDSI
uniref:autophagy-related protein 11-like n=1 Tax=Scatophagus argus TaxID=75038 RepID=UPI001ED83601|nr:autophagy-related protein 11-like [Scatophagus argus]